MNWLKYLVAFAAIIIAGCAAYFSVTGLSILFNGASFAVGIMATSLEIAKLITATYLKQKWSKIKGFSKWYLTFAVIVLMLITSAGIFGYLSNAFQQQNIKLDQVQREISVWNVKIDANNQEIKSLNGQLNNLQNNQGKILDNKKINNRLLRSVDNRDKEVSKLSDKVSGLQNENVQYSEKINEIKNTNINLEREVGGFRFVAEAFGVELKNVVKFFIILIVIVFDPLAIALVIAFNGLIGEDDEKMILSEGDFKIFSDAISNPSEPNDKLKGAAEKYRNFTIKSDIPGAEEAWERARKIHQERIDNGETFEDEPTAFCNSGLTDRDEPYEFHVEEIPQKTQTDVKTSNNSITQKEITEDNGSKKKI